MKIMCDTYTVMNLAIKTQHHPLDLNILVKKLLHTSWGKGQCVRMTGVASHHRDHVMRYVVSAANILVITNKDIPQTMYHKGTTNEQ